MSYSKSSVSRRANPVQSTYPFQETDKATIDVEAPEDGVLGKIVVRLFNVVTLARFLTPTQVQDGAKNVSVGRVIALLAEEGDDISNLEVPKEEPKSAPTPQPETSAATPSPSQAPEPAQEPKTRSHHPTHSKHLMPSVVRLLIEGGVTDAEVIKGTGVRGMLTKGDVLAYLGRASNPLGTYKPPQVETTASAKTEAPAKVCLTHSFPKTYSGTTCCQPLDGDAIRQLIVSGLATKLKPPPHGRSLSSTVNDIYSFTSAAPSAPVSFDSIIADYLPPARQVPPSTASVPPTPKDSTAAYFDGLF